MWLRKVLQYFLLVGILAIYGLAFGKGWQQNTKEYTAMKVCRGIERAKTSKKVVALTFDDGPHQKYTEAILDILQRNNIRATFFVIGKNAQRYPQIIAKIYKNGNVIGNHSYSHFYLTKLTAEEVVAELTKTSELVSAVIKEYPILFRPPYGVCSVRSAEITRQLGFITIVWDDMANDYEVNHTTPEMIAADVIKLAKPGSIIGLHDGGGNRKKTVMALPIIINTLRAAGYEFLTLSEMLNIKAYR